MVHEESAKHLGLIILPKCISIDQDKVETE